MTVAKVIKILEALPASAKIVLFHICGSTDAFLHVSRDPATELPIGISLDYDSLDDLYTNEDGEDERGDWR
ncbi:MAG: hypothetical protein NC114_06565 [Ruminococcus flavefaciens]|nr:hypothetical protein [Ruminococcus flavefaciens]